MACSIIILFLPPFVNTSVVRNSNYRPFYRASFYFFVAIFLFLIWLGQRPVEDKTLYIAQLATIGYFSFFTILIPVSGIIETKLAFYNPKKIK